MYSFDPPENIRKLKVFWYYQGESEGNIEKGRVKKSRLIFSRYNEQNFFFIFLMKSQGGFGLWSIHVKYLVKSDSEGSESKF